MVPPTVPWATAAGNNHPPDSSSEDPVPSIHPRPSGTYKVAYRLDGKQSSLTVATLADAQAAVRLMDRFGIRDALALIDAQASAHADIPTVAELVTAHVERLDGITPGTRRDYLGMVKRTLDDQPLGQIPVNLVSRDSVLAWHRWLRDQGLSSKTIRNHHALVSAAMTDAVEQGIAPSNPCRGVRIAQVEKLSDKVFLSPGEFAVLLAAIPHRYQPLVATLAGTGLRWSEATALTVGDLDLDTVPGLLRVTKAWKRTGDRSLVLGPPKSKAGHRTVSLGPELVDILRPLVDGRASDEVLFTGPRGGPVQHHRFHYRVWKPTLDRLNARFDADGQPCTPLLAKRPRIHDLRHTHASALISAGVNLLEVKDRLGHEKIDTTVSVYGHLAPQSLARTAAASSAFLVQALPELEA